jgi:hypothetical protein
MAIFVKQNPAAVAVRGLPVPEMCFRIFQTPERETSGNASRAGKRSKAPAAWNESVDNAMIADPTSNLR